MVVIEVEENANCEPMDMRVFHDLEPAKALLKVRLEKQLGEYGWYEVVSWDKHHKPGPARVQKVDDSGDGVAYLISGSDYGVRLRPEEEPKDWKLDEATQWGEPLLLLGDPEDFVVQE